MTIDLDYKEYVFYGVTVLTVNNVLVRLVSE